MVPTDLEDVTITCRNHVSIVEEHRLLRRHGKAATKHRIKRKEGNTCGGWPVEKWNETELCAERTVVVPNRCWKDTNGRSGHNAQLEVANTSCCIVTLRVGIVKDRDGRESEGSRELWMEESTKKKNHQT